MFRLSNIRIGIKLAVMSGLGVLLVLGMVALESMNNSTAREANDDVNRRQVIVQGVLQSKYEFSALQIAVRDLRLATVAGRVKDAMTAATNGVTTTQSTVFRRTRRSSGDVKIVW